MADPEHDPEFDAWLAEASAELDKFDAWLAEASAELDAAVELLAPAAEMEERLERIKRGEQ